MKCIDWSWINFTSGHKAASVSHPRSYRPSLTRGTLMALYLWTGTSWYRRCLLSLFCETALSLFKTITRVLLLKSVALNSRNHSSVTFSRTGALQRERPCFKPRLYSAVYRVNSSVRSHETSCIERPTKKEKKKVQKEIDEPKKTHTHTHTHPLSFPFFTCNKDHTCCRRRRERERICWMSCSSASWRRWIICGMGQNPYANAKIQMRTRRPKMV